MLFVCVTHHKVQGRHPICQSVVDKLLPLVISITFRRIIQQFPGDVENGYLLTTWARKITCQVKKCEQTLLFIAVHYWGYTSLEIKGHWGLHAPDCLPPHHSGPATTDFQSSTSVEACFWGRHMDVQGLLHQQLLSSTMVKCCGLLHAIGSGGVSPMHGLLQLTSLSSHSHSHLGIPSVSFIWWQQSIQLKCW